MATKKTIETVNKQKISTQADFILSPKHHNSMRSLISSNPEGIDNKTIAKVLLMTEEEVEKTYQSALLKLRKVLAKEI